MENKKFYLFVIGVMAIFCTALVYENVSDRRSEKQLNNSLLEMKSKEWEIKENRLKADSISSFKIKDSLRTEFNNFQKRSYNEINKLHKRIKAIQTYSSSSDFRAYNDSIELFLTGRH